MLCMPLIKPFRRYSIMKPFAKYMRQSQTEENFSEYHKGVTDTPPEDNLTMVASQQPLGLPRKCTVIPQFPLRFV